MKIILFAILLITSLTQAYQVPDLYYDQTAPTCTNVNGLIATANADLARLTNYVNVTLPDRAAKLNDVLASIQKTCKIISSSTPSLVQLRTSHLKKKSTALSQLQSASHKIQKAADELYKITPVQFLAQIKLMTANADTDNVCENAISAINALQAYIAFLIPSVRENYVDGAVLDRVNDLSSFSNKCNAAACSSSNATAGSDASDDEGTGTGLTYKKGDTVVFHSMGTIWNGFTSWMPNYNYLSGLSSSGLLYVVKDNSDASTHWKVHINSDNTYSFENLGSTNKNYLYLSTFGNGRAGLGPSKDTDNAHFQIVATQEPGFEGLFSVGTQDYIDAHFWTGGDVGTAGGSGAGNWGTFFKVELL